MREYQVTQWEAHVLTQHRGTKQKWKEGEAESKLETQQTGKIFFFKNWSVELLECSVAVEISRQPVAKVHDFVSNIKIFSRSLRGSTGEV